MPTKPTKPAMATPPMLDGKKESSGGDVGCLPPQANSEIFFKVWARGVAMTAMPAMVGMAAQEGVDCASRPSAHQRTRARRVILAILSDQL